MDGERSDIALLVLDSVRASTFYDLLDAGDLDTLEKLDKRGVRYPQAIANGPWTVPSHGSMFTGKYPTEHGITGTSPGWDSAETFLDRLKAAGYTSVGISANPWLSSNYGFSDSFDHFLTRWEYFFNNEDMSAVVGAETRREQMLALARRLRTGNPAKNLGNLLYMLTEVGDDDSGGSHLVSRAQKRLSRTDSPIFLFANFTEAHLPYQPPREYAEWFLPDGVDYGVATTVPQDPWEYVSGALDMEDSDFEVLSALYRGSIQYLDDIVSDLLASLAPDATVIVTGDHGENVGEFELMDHQYSVHQTLLKVPLIVAGSRTPTAQKDLVELRDLYSTVLDMADVDVPAAAPGVSLLGEETRDHAISEYLSPRPDLDTLRSRSTDLRHPERVYSEPRRVVQTTTHKLIHWGDGIEELRDIADTPLEDTAMTEELSDRLFETVDLEADHDDDGDRDVSQAVESRLEELGYI